MTGSIGQHVKWTLLARFGAQVVQLVFSFFLARLVTPQDFGVMNIITVIIGFGLTICDLGLSSALIYLGDPSGRLRDTLFWILTSVNLAFAMLLIAGTSLITRFFDIDSMSDIFIFAVFTSLIQAFAQLQTTVLSQKFDFKALGIASFVAAVLASVIAVATAMNGWGIWALAWQNFINQFITAALCLYFTRWIPRLHFSTEDAGKALRYGIYLVGHNVLNFTMRNADNLIVGKALGNTNLGLYNRAYALMLLPLQNIGAIAGQVMFPTLAAMKGDHQRFRETYLGSVKFIATVAFPAMAGLCILSREVLATVYGSQWVGAAGPLSILSLVGLFQSIIFPVGWIYTALGKTKEQFRLSVILLVIFFALIAAGLPWGILGVSVGYAGWALISGVWNVVICGRLIGLPPSVYFASLKVKVLMTTVMSLVVLALRWATIGSIASGFIVLSCMIIGAVTYIGAGLLLKDPEVGMIVSRLTKRLGART